MDIQCKECGEVLQQTLGKRERQFCNSTCRSNFWQKMKRKTKFKTDEKAGIKVKFSDNGITQIQKPEIPANAQYPLTENECINGEEINKQIEVIRNEVKPSFILKAEHEKSKEARIQRLKNELK